MSTGNKYYSSEDVIFNSGNDTGSRSERHRLLIIPRIFCLIIAFFIWVYAMNISAEDYEKTFTLVDIKIEGAEKLAENSNMSVIDIEESKANITVTGLRQDVLALSADDFVAYADVSSLSGAERHAVGVSVSLPSGVALVSVSPSMIMVSTDSIVTKKIPVSISVNSYSMVKQYEFGDMTADLNEITVEGPSTVLDRISYARAPISLGTQWITTSFVQKSNLELIDSSTGKSVSSQYVTMSSTSVTVNIPVIETLEVPLAVEYGSLADRSRIQSVDIKPSTVSVTGDPNTVELLKKLIVFTVKNDTPENSVIKFDPACLPSGIRLNGEAPEIFIKLEFVPAETTPVTVPPTDEPSDPPTDEP